MSQWLSIMLHNPIVLAALGGWATAATVDWQAFKKFQSWHDLAEFGWGTATFRWVQGIVLGAAPAIAAWLITK